MKLKVRVKPMPLRCWQHPWGLRRLVWRGMAPHEPRGWQLGLGVIGFEFWP